MAKWTGKKVGVSFNKPDEPSFLKEFKRRAGYKEGPNVRDKFAEMPEATEEDFADNEEDLPLVVSEGKGCLSQQELESLQHGGKMKELLASGSAKDETPASGEEGDQKIVFTKRPKRPIEEQEEEKAEKKERKRKKKEQEKKKKLLSFDDEVEEEE